MPWIAALLGLCAGVIQARLWPRILRAATRARLGLAVIKLLLWLLPTAFLVWQSPLAATLYAGCAGLTMTVFVFLQRREL